MVDLRPRPHVWLTADTFHNLPTEGIYMKNTKHERRLGMESLEDRRLLAGSIDLDGGVLRIDGTSADDTAYVKTLSSGIIKVTLSHNGQTHARYFHPSTINSIRFIGGDGNDYFRNDTDIRSHAVGNNGNDTLIGGSNYDYLSGGSGNDILSGRDSSDSIHGGWGNDIAYGGNGNDYISGGQGNDRLYAQNGNDYVTGGDGIDYLYGGSGADSLYGGDDIDVIYGGSGNDYLNGGNGSDYLFGQAGNDRLYGENGNDNMWGGTGTDFFSGGSGYDRARDWMWGESFNTVEALF